MSVGQCGSVADAVDASKDEVPCAVSPSPMPQHHVSVAGVVVDPEGRVLAVRRRDNGAWELPGAVLERGELVEDGLARGIKEEAGVLVDVVRLSGVYKHIARGIVAIVFYCELAHELETDWAETVGVRWMDRIEVADRMTPVFAQRVLDALDRGSNSAPAVRHHDGGHSSRRCTCPSRTSTVLGAD